MSQTEPTSIFGINAVKDECVFVLFRNSTSTERRYRRSSTQSQARRLITSSYGRRHPRPTASSVRVYCGVWPGRVCDVQSVG